jgi:hypothetical protein
VELKGTVFKEWHAQRQHKVELDSEGTPGGEVAEAQRQQAVEQEKAT